MLFQVRLLLKMNQEQFQNKYTHYLELGSRYVQMLSESDTIEDTLTLDIKAAEIELLIFDSIFLPFPKFMI